MFPENDVNDPTAQGQQPGAESQESAQGNQEAGVNPGIQQRIDQLTAKFHSAERHNQVLAEQNQKLLDLLAKSGQPQQTEAAPEIDPEDAKRLDYFLKQATAPLMKEIESLKASASQQRVAAGYSEVQHQLEKVNNPAVTQRVNELISGWQRNGWLGTVATPTDALRMAIGEVALGQLTGAAGAREEQGRFNAMSVPLGGHGGAAARQPQKPAVDFDNMSLDQQSAYLDQQLEGKEF